MSEIDRSLIKEYVILAQEGNAEGFESLWNYFAPRVKSYVICRINQKQDADDLLSDIFIRVFNKIDSCNSAKGAFSTWVFTITKDVLTDYFGTFSNQIQWVDSQSLEILERSGHIQSLYSKFQSSIEELDQQSDNRDILLQQIEQVLDELPKQYAELIRMKFFFGMENKEIAELKSKTQGNIRVSLHRALIQAEKLIKRLNL